jgi:hypothetical protein
MTLGMTEEELEARLRASRDACGVPERVEDEAVCGRLARWIGATTDREADVLPMTTQKGA